KFITCFFFNQLLSAASSHDGILRRMATVIHLLPPGNRIIFQEMVSLFHKLDQNQEVTKMSASSLAIIFAPTMLRYNVSDLSKMLSHSEAATRAILLCITNYNELFEVISFSFLLYEI